MSGNNFLVELKIGRDGENAKIEKHKFEKVKMRFWSDEVGEELMNGFKIMSLN